jgi:hypothetical protein
VTNDDQGFAQKATLVLFRVISLIDFGGKLKAIHELTRTNTKADVSLVLTSISVQ